MSPARALQVAASVALLTLVAACDAPGASQAVVPPPGPDTAAPAPDTAAVAPDTDPGEGVAPDAGPDDTAVAEDPGAPGEDATAPPEDTGPPDTLGPIADVNNAPKDVGIAKQPLGGVCNGPEECETGGCNPAHPGGYCTVWCASHDDCPDGGKCYKDTLSPQKMCWKPCATSADCRLDQLCGQGLCVAKCQAGLCSGGYVCDEDSGQCVPPGQVTCTPGEETCNTLDDDCDGVTDEGCGPGVSDSPSVLVTDLGRVQVGGGGLSKQLFFDLSTAASSFTVLVLDADGAYELTALWELYAPDGTQLVDATDPLAAPVPSLPDNGAVAVQVPITPMVSPAPGKYRFTVYREGGVGAVWVYVIQSLRPSPTTSTLDLNLWFVGTPGLGALTAPTSTKFQAMLDIFYEVLDAHGISVGNVYYFDVIGSNAQKYTYVDVADDPDDPFALDEHAELLKLSADLPNSNRGVNLFFVQGFNGWGLLGKAGGIPGPALRHGTYRSGVVVSLADYYGSPQNYSLPATAETMAHELGHQVGLFHTSEQNGKAHDPIPDTPQCSNDANGNGYVEPWECKSQGAENLMFWTRSFSAGLSPGQKYVIHRNASMYDPP